MGAAWLRCVSHGGGDQGHAERGSEGSAGLETRFSLCYCHSMNRLAFKRLLERLGFVHVAGWVRVEDAPAIRRKIESAKADVEKAKKKTGANHEN